MQRARAIRFGFTAAGRPLGVALLAGLAAVAGRTTVPAQTVREQVEVHVVTVRVTARDRSGKPVEDLKAEELALTVDGTAAALDTWTLQGLRPAVTLPSNPPVGGTAAAAPVSTATATAAAPTTGHVHQLAIVIDESESKSFDRRDVEDQLTRFLEQPDAARRRILLARFDGSRLTVESPWSDSAAGAIEGIARIRAHPSAERLSGASDLVGSRTSREEFDANRARLCRALLEALALFPPEAGDRQLVFASGGTSLMHPLDVSDYIGQEQRLLEQETLPLNEQLGQKDKRSFANYDAARQAERDSSAFQLWSRTVNPGHHVLTMSDVIAKAVEIDVALVPVVVESLDRDRRNVPGAFADSRTRDSGASGLPTGATPSGTLSPSYRLGVAQVLTSVAADTGGEAILLPGKTAARLTELDGRAVYELTFRDPAGADRRLHRFELVCRRAGVTLEYRRGYRIASEEDRALDAVIARLVDRGAAPDPLLSASLAESKVDGRSRTRVILRLTPPRESEAPDERDLAVVAVGEDSSGTRTEPVRWTATGHRVEGTDGYSAVTDLGVPYGSFTWSLAVTDLSTGLTTFALAAAH
ncbi:MAG TPA: VWA domain-containing protein [Thermoanaerobaculia bacterium]|nr:VWA domain-containing protein [Thermoanaerobaculia bacterium]